MSEEFKNKKIRCVEEDCEKEFDWSPEEQKWFKDKGLKYPPVRCLDCRRKRRLQNKH